MEGRWGRRIYGTVIRGPESTRFTLVMEQSEGKAITQINFLPNDELDRYPHLYSFILNKMTDSVESALNHTKGVQP